VFWITTVPVSLLRKTQIHFQSRHWKKIGYGNFFKRKFVTKPCNHRTVNLFELHQYIYFLIEKMQNTFSEPPVKKNWVMGIVPKRKLVNKHRHITGRESILNTQYLLFPYEKMQKIFQSQQWKKNWVMEFVPKELSPKHRSHQQDMNLFEFHCDNSFWENAITFSTTGWKCVLRLSQ